MNRLPLRSFSAFGRTAANLTWRHGYNNNNNYYHCQYGSITTTRGLASTTSASESQKELKRKLPLSGVKVLDMTRVLAGVFRARGMVQKIDHPSCGPIDLIAPPVKYSSADPSIRRPPPLLGEHTEEVLGEVVGIDAARIEDLRKKGVVA